MKHLNIIILGICIILSSCKPEKKDQMASDNQVNETDIAVSTDTKKEPLDITPISHATMVMRYGEDLIYVDPTGGAEAFSAFEAPEYVLITDIHGDHYHQETLQALDLSASTVIAPTAVIEKFPEDLKIGTVVAMDNGTTKTFDDFEIEAIPMYNLREEALKFHPKGRGNGYVLTIGGERIYISGDTEDIPEMRNLTDIDKAFVCMNLPYTMTVDKAAEAVLEFKPKTVYPYHYRGTDGLSDVGKFKTLVNQGDESIEVVQWDWYQ
ncbi:MAG: MBL fold metallo-hydrolase [Algicola sp.]|nr:MBL fold metallo-hydrolase [Algicola sp.]